MGLREARVQQQQIIHRSVMKEGPAAVSTQQSVDPLMIALAHRLADAAAAVTTPYFRQTPWQCSLFLQL